MKYTRVLVLLFFAFFFTGLAGCRSSLTIADFAIVSEFQILQSVAVEARSVDRVDPESITRVDLPD